MRAVFLDRDGVLNRPVLRNGKPHPPADLSELEILPGVPEGLDRLKALGFLLIVVTNQPDVRRGVQSRETVEAIHRMLRAHLPLDDIFTCYHDDPDHCLCRKPQPGMILEAARKHSLDLSRSFLVGDRWRDIEAGTAAGCRTVWIDCGYQERPPQVPAAVAVTSFPNAAAWIAANMATVSSPQHLRVKLFADGADKATILDYYRNPLIRGFTTNPTLMRHAGIEDYEAFSRDLVQAIPDRPVSLEVFADDFPEMARQAGKLASFGSNVYVKIPITNTRRESAVPLIASLARQGIKVNVTAVLTLDQVRAAAEALAPAPAAYLSIFAGRIADTGRDPVPLVSQALRDTGGYPNLELIWASPREVLNVVQADAAGCHIITATVDILKKLPLLGKDLDEFSLETVKMFHDDARRANYSL